MAESAIIHVTALTGSNIIFSKNGIIINGLYSSEGFVDQLDTALTHYYYNVQPQAFGEWTITASRDNNTTNKSVIINENKEYNISFTQPVYLYAGGSFNSNYQFTKLTKGGSITTQASQLYYASNSNSNYSLYYRWEGIDLTNYREISCDSICTIQDGKTTIGIAILITKDPSSVIYYKNVGSGHKTYNDYTHSTTAIRTSKLDITDITGTWYVYVGLDSWDEKWVNWRRVYYKDIVIK